MKRISGVVFLLFSLRFALAQGTDFKAKLEPAPATGFYRVQLSAEVLAGMNGNLQAIRIYDWKNREVPYLLEREEPVQTRRYFREYPVVEKSFAGKKTTLVLRNPDQNAISNISLVIKNTNVVKQADLSGSNDGKTWYALEDNFVLQSVGGTEQTSEVKSLEFPLSDYGFYRLQINDSLSAPLNILAAGYYDFESAEGNYTELENLKITIRDSSEVKRTYIRISAANQILLNRLAFTIDSPAFFFRNATVFEKQNSVDRRGRRQEQLVPIKTFQLRSDSKNVLDWPDLHAGDLFLKIENADNPPLKIREVKAFVRNVYLVAELKEKRAYELRFGSSYQAAPSYDLQYFRSGIPENLTLVQVRKPEFFSGAAAAEAETESPAFFRDKRLIWVALILVIGFLGYMTFRMLQEVKEK
ncbi:DUF3999 domain-containing protein [Adhaeribacter soli]|uniref:DUF3999 domain-containing protein n=1 Tax=Adhaeribacter soli TaxID=2607655 RepID=A0A5N1J380_9BACT|nr:DUF3999 domain-containing protein [Adhaeribacter soli]KAA9339013.1 DUF3999 domain-containing protein [Adhaeribacter soli]